MSVVRYISKLVKEIMKLLQKSRNIETPEILIHEMIKIINL